MTEDQSNRPNESDHEDHEDQPCPPSQPKAPLLSEFSKAIERLEARGFITELWVDTNTQTITLRWVKNSAKWHITAHGLNHLNAHLETMGRQASLWCLARARGTANEANYAVPET